MAIKYVTKQYYHKRDPITPVEIERETAKCVWVKGSRSLKRSDWEQYHDTWGEAKAHLLERAGVRFGAATRALSAAEAHLADVEKLEDI